ncbi:MAG: hypothetical protein LBF42_01565 [Puniceicoccales bacterium]|nr:hypothetical protein [Puniceicoccales bacterium]
MSIYKKEDIVYVDENGIDRHLHRRNARMPDQQRGRRCLDIVAGKKFQRTNIVAG